MDMDDIINTQNNITSSTSLPSSPTPQNQITQQQQQFWLMMTNNNNNNPSSHHHHHHRHHSFNLNDNHNDDPENDNDDDKEAMFEKPLTPSDVGKLNRLVIPKQHAERYFPLGGDAAAEKGLLLSFEDDSGKAWRFRYSYWNSSQSYVLTKGWSRYVKDNRLLAGDVVLFRRLRSRSDRLFIACRRRPAAAADSSPATTTTVPYPAHPHYNNNNNSRHLVASVVPYQPDSIHAGLLSPAHHQSQTTTVGNNSGSSNNNNNNNSSKILRLFGVNLECHDHQDQSEPSTPDGSSLSSQDLLLQPHHHQQFYPQAYYSNHLHNHMDFTFSRDVKPMRNRRG